MYDLVAVANECMKELDNLNIKYGIVDEFSINTRAKYRWGQCCRVEGTTNHFTINIAKCLLDERNDVSVLKDTLIHELLHTVKGCLNHKAEWKRLADKVNVAYGYQIQRCTSVQNKGFDKSVYDEIVADRKSHKRAYESYKYIIECKDCGRQYHYKRKTYAVANPDKCRCGVCKGDLMVFEIY